MCSNGPQPSTTDCTAADAYDSGRSCHSMHRIQPGPSSSLKPQPHMLVYMLCQEQPLCSAPIHSKGTALSCADRAAGCLRCNKSIQPPSFHNTHFYDTNYHMKSLHTASSAGHQAENAVGLKSTQKGGDKVARSHRILPTSGLLQQYVCCAVEATQGTPCVPHTNCEIRVPPVHLRPAAHVLERSLQQHACWPPSIVTQQAQKQSHHTTRHHMTRTPTISPAQSASNTLLHPSTGSVDPHSGTVLEPLCTFSYHTLHKYTMKQVTKQQTSAYHTSLPITPQT